MKKLISITITLVMLLSLMVIPVNAMEKIQVLVNTNINFQFNGEEFIPRELDGSRVYPLTYKDRTYIPARFIAEKAGLEVTWEEKSQTVGFLTDGEVVNRNITPPSEELKLTPFTDSVILNTAIRFEFDGVEFIPKETDGSRVYPLSYKDRTFIPARFIAEKAGIIVTWDEKTQTVGLYTKEYVADHEGQIPGGNTGNNGNTGNDNQQHQVVPPPPAAPLSPSIAAEYAALRNKIESMRVQYMGFDTTYGSTQKNIEKRFALIPYLGVETVNYPEVVERTRVNAKYNNNGYQAYKDSAQFYLPSYADLYIYYMKNNTNKTDREILDHLNKVYSLDINETTTLIPINQSDIFRRSRMGLPVEVTDDSYESYARLGITSTFADIPGNGKTFQFQHMGWAGEFLRTEYFVGQNDALVSSEIFTKFSVKLNPLMADYQTYLEYYVSQKIHPSDKHSGVYTDRFTQINQYIFFPFSVMFDNNSQIVCQVNILPSHIKYFNDSTETNLTHWKRFYHVDKSTKELIHTICWPDLQ